jgi:predicted flap endonuclease-1-like 5' DNA nuclease
MEAHMFEIKYPKRKSVCKVRFSLPVSGVGAGRDVRVLGDFNDWSWIDGLKLKQGKQVYTGTFELPVAAALYQFRYLVDGEQWMNDPTVDRTVMNAFGTSNMVLQVEAGVTPAQTETTKKSPKQATAKKAPAKKSARKTSKSRTTGTDDLKLIEGIGPKIAGLLAEAGITTFAALAKAKAADLKAVLEAAGPRFRLAKTDTWKEQAKLAAAGKLEELKKLQGKLKGGVRK